MWLLALRTLLLILLCFLLLITLSALLLVLLRFLLLITLCALLLVLLCFLLLITLNAVLLVLLCFLLLITLNALLLVLLRFLLLLALRTLLLILLRFLLLITLIALRVRWGALGLCRARRTLRSTRGRAGLTLATTFAVDAVGVRAAFRAVQCRCHNRFIQGRSLYARKRQRESDSQICQCKMFH